MEKGAGVSKRSTLDLLRSQKVSFCSNFVMLFKVSCIPLSLVVLLSKYVGLHVCYFADIPEEDIRCLEPFNASLPEGLSLILEFVTPQEEDWFMKNLMVDTSQGRFPVFE